MKSEVRISEQKAKRILDFLLLAVYSAVLAVAVSVIAVSTSVLAVAARKTLENFVQIELPRLFGEEACKTFNLLTSPP